MSNHRHHLNSLGEALDAEIRVLTEQLKHATERNIALLLKVEQLTADVEMYRSQANSTAQRV